MVVSCCLTAHGGTYPSQLWQALDSDSKFYWVIGFRDGLGVGASHASNYLTGGNPSKLLDVIMNSSDELLINCDNTAQLTSVMDNLYKDPANIRIMWVDMAKAAWLKIAGKDYETALVWGRRSALSAEMTDRKRAAGGSN